MCSLFLSYSFPNILIIYLICRIPCLSLRSWMRVWWSFELVIEISCLSFDIPDEPPFYVRQCSLYYISILELSGGLTLCILFIVCSAIHNCLPLGSFPSQHLGSMWQQLMWLTWLYLQIFIDTSIHSYNIM